ncbi:MAG: WG repeat-containing protein [Bacteroidia bacterium]
MSFALQLFRHVLISCLMWGGTALGAVAQVPDLLPIRKDNLFGYGDAQLNLKLQPEYEDAMPFVQGRAVVKKDGLYGLINESGEWVLEPKYQEIAVGKLLRIRQGDRWGLAGLDGCMTTSIEFQSIHELKSGHYLLDRRGQKGMANSEGFLVVPCAFDMVTQLRDDQGNHVELYSVQLDGLMGLYNACGAMVQPPRFSRIDIFQEGFAVVQEGHQFGMVDIEGQLRVPCEYDQLQGMSEGLVGAKLKNRWGYVDGNGKQRLDFLYEAVQEGGFFQGRSAVNKAGNWLQLQRNGEVEFPMQEGYQSLGRLSEGLIPVCKLLDEGAVRYGYVDPDGKLRIPLRYERAEEFVRGFAIVCMRMANDQSMVREMRYGIIDRTGKAVIPLELRSQTEARLKRDSLGHLGFATLHYNGRTCRIDAHGNRFDCERSGIDLIQKEWMSTRCEGGDLVAVAKDGLWGFCDRKGKVVIACAYASVGCFSGGVARVTLSGSPDRSFYITEQGKQLVLPTEHN